MINEQASGEDPLTLSFCVRRQKGNKTLIMLCFHMREERKTANLLYKPATAMWKATYEWRTPISRLWYSLNVSPKFICWKDNSLCATVVQDAECFPLEALYMHSAGRRKRGDGRCLKSFHKLDLGMVHCFYCYALSELSCVVMANFKGACSLGRSSEVSFSQSVVRLIIIYYRMFGGCRNGSVV